MDCFDQGIKAMTERHFTGKSGSKNIQKNPKILMLFMKCVANVVANLVSYLLFHKVVCKYNLQGIVCILISN